MDEHTTALQPEADREALVRRLQDEVEYRVRTAAALAKFGHSVQPEVDAGRARIAVLAARQPVPTVNVEQVREAAKPIHEALGGLYPGDYRHGLAAEALAQALVLLKVEVRDV